MRTDRRKFLRGIAASAAGVAIARTALGTPASGTTALQFWDMSWGPPGYLEVASGLIDMFNRRQSSINVSYKLFQWSTWPQLFDSAAATGTLPDISTGGSYQGVQYDDQGHILDLSDLVEELERSGEAQDFLPGTLDRATYKGHVIGLPWAMDIRVALYRKDLFAKSGMKPPSTWKELRAAARAFTGNGQYGVVFAGKHIEGMQALLTLMINNGGGLFTAGGKLDLLNTRNVEAATFVADLVKDGTVNPRSAGLTLSEAHKEFLASGAAMMISPPALEKEYPDQVSKIGLLSPVAGQHGDKGTLSWVNSVMLYKSQNDPQATKTFLRWWSANQKPLWTSARSDSLPVRRSIAADPFFQGNPLTKQVLAEWVPVSHGVSQRSRSMFPSLNAVEGDSSLGTLLLDLLRGEEVIPSMRKAEESLRKIV